MLAGSTEIVATQIAETRFAVWSNHGRSTNAQRHTQGVNFEPTVKSVVDIAAGLHRRQGESRVQGCSTGVRTTQVEAKSTTRVDDRKWGARLKCCNSAECPMAQHSADDTGAACEEGHIPVVTDHKPVRAIEVGWTIGVSQIRLIVNGSVECRVATGGGIKRLRPCVCRLEIEGSREAMRGGHLQGMVIRPGIAGE